MMPRFPFAGGRLSGNGRAGRQPRPSGRVELSQTPGRVPSVRLRVAIRPPEPSTIRLTVNKITRVEAVELRAFSVHPPQPGDWTLALWLVGTPHSWLAR